MTSTNGGTTTLVCLFHHDDQARAALNDLYAAGIPESSVSVIGRSATGRSGSQTLEGLGLPARDLSHLEEGISAGGTIVTVFAEPGHVDTVERVFGQHSATKIDETDVDGSGVAPVAPLAAQGTGVAAEAGQKVIPVVEEELQVGKRRVDQGGVRVFRRVVEIPAEQSVNLREEHVVVERNPVNRPATQADLQGQGERSIELTETAEEVVISKDARVVEEVVLGKQVGEHTEHIHETVRRTEVEVENLAPADTRTQSNRK